MNIDIALSFFKERNGGGGGEQTHRQTQTHTHTQTHTLPIIFPSPSYFDNLTVKLKARGEKSKTTSVIAPRTKRTGTPFVLILSAVNHFCPQKPQQSSYTIFYGHRADYQINITQTTNPK